jgi:MoaA/NifB/PqqE/SkfB family radical SAM enzyme
MPRVNETQETPFCVDLELTEGCNLRCDFCGIQAIREGTGNFKFMTLPLAERIAASIAEAGWNSRLEFSGHGEPTVNPDFVEIVRMFRKHNPKNQLLMTSNGAGLVKDPTALIGALFTAGLNILCLDDYDGIKLVGKIRERYHGEIPLQEYPEDMNANPHRRRPRGTRMVVVIQDISIARKGVHSHINNRAGQGAPPTNRAEGKRCVKPFRDIVIRWDGNVNSCCNDYRGIIKVGNAGKSAVAELWNGPVFKSLRRYMYHGKRDFVPCKGCDFVGFRPGLLPDHMAKRGALPKPTPKDAEVMREATKGRTFTPIVLRKWEGGKE